MITNLSLENFKGANRRYTFGPANLVLGKNFSGKSAIDQAIRCLVLGYVPGVAKTSAGIKAFASAYPMRIGMAESGHGLEIAFEKVKATIKQTEDKTLAAAGIDDQTRVLFDPDIFFGLSDSARISKACELVMTIGSDRVNITAALARSAEGLKPYGLPPTVLAAPTVNDLLAAADTYWKTVRAELTADKTRMQKLTEGLTDMNAVDAELSKLPQAHEAKATVTRLNAEIQHLTTQIATTQANAQALARRAADRAYQVKAAQPLAASLALQQDAEALLATAEAALAARLTERTAAELALDAAQKDVRADQPTPPPALVWRTDPFETAKIGQQYSAHVTLTPTPTGPRVIHIAQWAAVPPAPVVDAEAEQERRFNAHSALSEAEDGATSATQAVSTAQADAWTAKINVRNLVTTIANATAAQNALARMDAAAVPSLATPEQVAAWEAERTQAAATRVQATVQIEAITRLEQDRLRIDEAAKKRTVLEARAKLVGSVLDLITQQKRALVSGSIEVPLAVANKLAAGILKGPLVFEVGEIGMRVGDRFISSRTFSGTESAIVMMGLTAGLAASSKLRVLMLDELGRLDAQNAAKLIANLLLLVADHDIDQFILIGPENPTLLASLNGTAAQLNLIAVE